jgi:hypothetical protein
MLSCSTIGFIVDRLFAAVRRSWDRYQGLVGLEADAQGPDNAEDDLPVNAADEWIPDEENVSVEEKPS